MKWTSTIAYAVAALTMTVVSNSLAQSNVQLNHDSSWEIIGRQCIIRASEISNIGNESTGPLFVSIYVKGDTGYDGTGSPGRLLARAEIAPIPANSSINNLVLTTRVRGSASGEKYSALLVEEKVGRKYLPANYVVYTSTYTFPRRQNGGLGSEDGAVGVGDIGFHGTASLAGTGRRGDFDIEKIQNRREGIELSGLLRLAIYATPEPYNGSVAPNVVATRVLGRLAPGDYYQHLQGRLNLRRPGRGLFYLTVALEEDQGAGFQTLSYMAVSEPRQF